MTNADVARLFDELADIMEIAGENFFKIKAYRNASGIISQLDRDLNKLPSEKLNEIAGIGKAISEKIQTALNTGSFPTLEKWRQNDFASFRPLLLIPGLTMRQLRAIIKSNNLTSIADLKKLVANNSVNSIDKLDENTKQSLANFLERMP